MGFQIIVVLFLHSQFHRIIFDFHFFFHYCRASIILVSNLSLVRSLAYLPPHFSMFFFAPSPGRCISCLVWFLITFQVINNSISQTHTHARKYYFWFSYYYFAFQTHGYRFKIDGHINKKAPFSILSSLSIGSNVDAWSNMKKGKVMEAWETHRVCACMRVCARKRGRKKRSLNLLYKSQQQRKKWGWLESLSKHRSVYEHINYATFINMTYDTCSTS